MNPAARVVLNVGGSSRKVPIPDYYAGWSQLLLDIDPRGEPDLCCDARELLALDAGICDAVYCSHNLEHYYAHEVPRVLRGFHHVLKAGGFADIRVPDLPALMRTVVHDSLDIDDVLYQSPAGPVTVRDVIYGYGVEIERSGSDFFAHKTGFSETSLPKVLHAAGFSEVFVATVQDAIELRALAFKSPPSAEQRALLSLPASGGGD